MFRKLTLLSVFLTLIMVMLGALIRVADVDLSGLNPEVMFFFKRTWTSVFNSHFSGFGGVVGGFVCVAKDR